MAGYPARTASFPTRRLAERWAKTIEASMIEGRHFRSPEARSRTLYMPRSFRFFGISSATYRSIDRLDHASIRAPRRQSTAVLAVCRTCSASRDVNGIG
jgi:hypothetical protein